LFDAISAQIRRLYQHLVSNVTISSDDRRGRSVTLRYSDVCPQRAGQCVVDGRSVLFTRRDESRDDGRLPLGCVRASDWSALSAAAADGVSFEAATGTDSTQQRRRGQ